MAPMGKNDGLPPPLSGSVVNSFAFLTIKDRLPVILTKGKQVPVETTMRPVSGLRVAEEEDMVVVDSMDGPHDACGWVIY